MALGCRIGPDGAVALQLIVFREALRGHPHYRVDQGAFTHLAPLAITGGHSAYGTPSKVSGGVATLLAGHYASGFGYPPLAPIFGAAVSYVLPFASETTTVALRPLAVLVIPRGPVGRGPRSLPGHRVPRHT